MNRTTADGSRTPTVRADMPARSPDEERRFRDSLLLKARRRDLTLDDLDHEERTVLGLLPVVGDTTGYGRLLELRKAAYRAHTARMTAVPAGILDFVAAMTGTFGPEVRMWALQLPWLEALLVARYGEEPSVWPAEFDAADEQRALDWAVRNEWPLGASRLPASTKD